MTTQVPRPPQVPGDPREPPPELERPGAATVRWAATSVAIGLAVLALYIGRDLFVPFALAVLLSFMLDPLVTLLRRWRVPRVPAVVLVMACTVALLGALSLFIGTQVMTLARNLPTYEQTIHHKLTAVRKTLAQPGMLTDVGRAFDVFETEFDAARQSLESAPRRGTVQRVQIEPTRESALQSLRESVTPILTPLVNAGIVFIFVVFILLERNDLRERMLRLVGGNIQRSTDATNEAARRVSRYLTTQMLVNAGYAVPMALGLAVIGVPGALLWGTLAGVLRFLPYLGPLIGATFPLLLAFAVDPGWDMLVWTAVLITVIELVSNNVVEPWLYGASTGLAPVAILMSATFWALLWGPVGLILATPLTVCLVVMARHVAPLRFLDVLLSNEPVFDPPTRLYQRLLAGDVEETIELASEQVGTSSHLAFYNDVALPALRRAADDHTDHSSVEHRLRLSKGMAMLIAGLREERPPLEEAALAAPPVLCIGARWDLDTLAADMWAEALAQDGVAARCLPPAAITAASIAALDVSSATVACLSYFSEAPEAHVRYVAKRLRRRAPQLQIVVGLWRATPAQIGSEAAAALGVQAVVASLDEAVLQVAGLLPRVAPADAPSPAVIAAEDKARSAALQASGALAPELQAPFDQAAQRLADAFGVSIAAVVLLAHDHQLWHGAAGLHRLKRPESLRAGQERELPLDFGFCHEVASSDQELVVSDIERDPRHAGNAGMGAAGLRFFGGVPLRTAAGEAIGALCVMDPEPRRLSDSELALLKSVARDLMALLAPRAPAPRAPVELAPAR